MNRLLANAYNEELSNSNDVGVDVDVNSADVAGVGVGADESGEMIENIDVSNENNFEGSNFGGDEWIRPFQQQPETLMGQGEAALRSPQHQQFRHQFDQIMPISIPPNLNNTIGNARNEVDYMKDETDQLRLQVPQDSHPQQFLMPCVDSIDGLQQIQDVDNMTSLNNFLQQQQQQQHRHSSLPNNSNEASETSLLEHQIAMMQRQQDQNTRSNQQKTETPNLTESLNQLRKLQEQQQQILKNISRTGLVDTSSLMNPWGALLNTLIEQINPNNDSSDNSNKNAGIINNIGRNSSRNDDVLNNNFNNNVTNLDQSNSANNIPWVQLGGSQNRQPTNHHISQNTASMLTNASLQIQDKQQQHFQVDIAPINDAPLEFPQLRQPQSNTLNVTRQFESNNRASGNSSSFNMAENNNINLQFPSPPIIRKVEKNKKQKPKSFPTQLWDAMMTGGPSNDAAFEWLPDGKSFVVVDSAFFCKEILDRKFKQSKYGSFVRKLHRWGFIRLTSGTGTDCFHHPLFQRSRPELVTQIKCNSRNSKDGKNGQNVYARGEIHDGAQPSLMGVEKFIRAKVVSTEPEDVVI